MVGPLAASLFLLGLAANLHVFKLKRLAFDRVMGMRPDEVPSARGVVQTALSLLLLQFVLFNGFAARRGRSFHEDETHTELLLLSYVVVASALLLCPLNVCHYQFRRYVVRRLTHCLWPFQNGILQLPAHATPFSDVFLADGLTSLSKFIQDLSVALLLLLRSLTHEPKDLHESYLSKLKESPLPYFAASTPYILRATQCLISFQRTSNTNDRFLHLLNTMKYCSSLLVISVGAHPMLMGLPRPEHSSFFLLCAVFNSLYSFLWDVIMDWGLGQPNLPRRVAFLRHQLTYRPRKVYYLIIAVDFVLRIMWVTKWWDWMHHGVHFKIVSQLAEVVRRIIWNFVRVEWECMKHDILSSKKASADTLKLEGIIDRMPLMGEVEDDAPEASKSRIRTLGHPDSSFSAENSGSETSSTPSQSPSNGSNLLFHMTRNAGDDVDNIRRKERAPQDGHIASAAITVASYPGNPQAVVVSGRKFTASTRL
uniref:EXS domain-containing protein n=1 Tax=Hyaloperonospora arabidopsidis (strain Emoy2) TaxID=559515 RepID=M4BY88_HYAAE